jgi:uncharacterized membrane protein YdjX (TVP38/TMEM64 family)
MDQLSINLVHGTVDLGSGGLLLLAMSFVLISLSFLPRSPACIVAGLVYGVSAFPIALAGSTLGGLLGFLISRYLFQSRFRRLVQRRRVWLSILEAVDSQGWTLVLLLRLASPIPGSVTNYLLGLTRIRVWPYLIVTFFGIAPQTFLFILIGAAGPTVAQGGVFSAAKFGFLVASVSASAAIVWLIAKSARASLSRRWPGGEGDSIA